MDEKFVLLKDVDDKAIREYVEKSKTYKQVLMSVGARTSSTNYRRLRKRIETLSLDVSHFKQPGSHLGKNRKTSQELFVFGKFTTGQRLRARLVLDKIMEDVCSVCGLGSVWNDIPLVLQVDHINGDNKDNRVENLRLICPNCHSQTTTFCGRNCKKRPVTCTDCDKEVSRRGLRCRTCASKINNVSKVKPSKEELAKLLWEMPTTEIAKKLNVSDKAVSNWAKRYNLPKPPRGYWAKLRAKK